MVGSMIVAGLAGVTQAAVAASAFYTAAAFAINFAVSSIVTRIFADNPERQQDMGVRQQVPPSAVNAIPIAYGDAYMGGTFVDAVLSIDQKTMYYVMAVSSISPDGQFLFDNTKMYYGDRLMTFDGTDQTKVVSLSDEATPANVDTKISGNLFINLYKSNAAGTITPLNGAAPPSTVMGGADIAAALRWTGTRQMNGLAFAIVKLIYNQDAGTTQLSPITFKVAHYLNGATVAKPGDVWYDYLTNSVYGGAVDPSFIDSTSRTALNSYSDATITFENSSGTPTTQARYRINGVLDAGESVLSNLDRIMSACDSWMTYNAALGKWSVVVNKAETASYAFTDNNIIGDIRVSATDITSSINQVEARFPFKENRDQANFINIETPSGLLYPNEPVNKYSITYDLVNDSVQAHYLANRLLEQSREDLIVSFNTTYFGIQVEAGDVVSVTNSNYGWNAKLFRVMKVNEASLADGSLGARLELNEYNAQVYDDQTIRQFAPVPNSGLPSVMYFSPLSAPTVSASNPSSAIPNFNVSITIPATGRVTYSELYYTTVAVPTANDWKLLSTANTISGEALTPSSTYVFTNQVLPTGASTSETYYFSYIVGNDLANSTRSAIGTSFAWTPVSSGRKNAEAIVYAWSTTIPTISGSSTYTWSTDTVSPAPTGWFTTVSNTATNAQTLWKASVLLEDSVSAVTTTVNWSSASIVPFGYVGTTGAVSRIAYTATTLTLDSLPSVYIVSGDNLPAVNSWNSAPVRVASTANITTLSGLLTIDGVVLVANDRVLVKNQTASQNNGIYVAATTAWTRADDANTWNEFVGLKVFVSSGTANANTFWQSNAVAGGTLGTTPIAFTSTTIPTTTWTSTTPTLTTGQQVWQSDGVYNPTNNQTIWEVPYLSSLKVGNLSAISTNTGSLTVSGNITIGEFGNIRGGQTAYNTGNGFFLGYSTTTYKFSIGSSTKSMTWDGSVLTVTGGVIQTGTTGARLEMGGPSYAQALMGYNTSGGLTLGFDANNGQVFASNYVGSIAGDFDNNSSTSPALRGINTSTGNGVGIEGRSSNYFGGAFYGGSASSPVYINPTGSLPTQGAIVGALCVVGNLLYFHNGTTWKQVSLV